MALGAIIEQGAYSVGNFMVLLLIARWCSRAEYGAFATAYSIYILALETQNALILDPLLIFGRSRYAAIKLAYVCSMEKVTLCITSLPAALIASSGLVAGIGFGRTALSLNLVLCAAAFLVTAWFLFLRRSFYVMERPGQSIPATLLYLTSALVILFSFKQWCQQVQAYCGFLTLTAAGLAGGLLARRMLRGPTSVPATDVPNFKRLVHEHWTFGRWQAGAGILNSTTNHLQVILAAAILGVEAAGALRAMYLLIQPALQLIIVLLILGMGNLSAWLENRPTGQSKPALRSTYLVPLAVSMVYALLMYTFAESVEGVLFAGKYHEYLYLLPPMLFVPLVFSVFAYEFVLFMSFGIQKYLLPAAAITGATSMCLSYILNLKYGLYGASLSYLICGLVAALVNLALLYIAVRRKISPNLSLLH